MWRRSLPLGAFDTGPTFDAYLAEHGDKDGRISYLQVFRNASPKWKRWGLPRPGKQSQLTW
jgi:hypothetical protein